MTDELIQVKLFTAVREGNIAGMRRFLKLGADINGINQQGNTPIAFACSEIKTPEVSRVIRYLVKKGADVNHYVPGGFTALFFAVNSRRPLIVQRLLEMGANPNINFFPAKHPKVISTVLDSVYKRYLAAVIREKKGLYDNYSYIQREIYCCRSLMFLLTEAGAKFGHREVVPEYS